MSLFYQPEIPQGILTLSPDESRHAIKVLRLRSGDPIHLTDGKGCYYDAIVSDPDPRQCSFTILSSQIHSPKEFKIHIAIAPTKNADRIEWFVEKAIEIGIDKVSFVASKNSERKSINLDRVQKIAVSAMKQAEQSWLPKLSGLVPFKNILIEKASQKFIATVDPENKHHLKSVAKPGGNYLILIGPEGDFSPEELSQAAENGFQKVSLGPSRLRTETAGLAACHILNLING